VATKKEKEPSDSDWVRLQRLEESHKAYFWARIRRIGGWIVGSATTAWAGFDAFTKFMDWMTKK
jgi:hypothetical protein